MKHFYRLFIFILCVLAFTSFNNTEPGGPTVTITSGEADPTNNSPFSVTITFSESVTGFLVGEIVVGNGSAGNLLTSDNTIFTADITPTANGTVTVDVPDDVATGDVSVLLNQAATQFTIEYDGTNPDVTITSAESDPTNTSPFSITVTFNETVNGFDPATEIIVGNGSAGNFANPTPNEVWTADITPTAAGSVTVDVAGSVATDDAGNNNNAATQFTIEYDNTNPDVTITTTESDPTNNSPFGITITFDEPVNGFDPATEIVVGNGSAANFTNTTPNEVWTADITPAADGTVTVDINASVATDDAGNPNNAATQFTIEYDGTNPDVTITSGEGSATNNSPFSITVTFNEPVTGFDPGSEIIVGNGTAGNFNNTTPNEVWTADITPSAQGTVTVDVNASVATDAAGNGNNAATQFTIEYDTTNPDVTITSAESDPTNNSPFGITVTFDEPVNGFDPATEIVVGNGSAGNFTNTTPNEVWTADITPVADGTVTVDVNASIATDDAGNPNNAAIQFTINYDGSGPEIQTQAMDANNVFIDVTFTEGVYDNVGSALTSSDFTFTFLDNGGSVTDLTLSTIKQDDNPVEGSASALIGGESIIRFFFSFTGTASGDETVEISPFSGASVYDEAGNPMDAGQTTGQVNLIDLTPPTLAPDEIVLIDASTLEFTLSEELNIVEAGAVTGFSVAVAGTISSVTYTGKGTTNTITISGSGFTTSTTVAYLGASGNALDLNGLELGDFSGHPVAEAVAVTLSAGDLAFTEFRSDDNDDFQFVLLTDIPAGTKIRFTDYGWKSNNTLRVDGDERSVTWEADQFYFAGTEIRIYEVTGPNNVLTSHGSVSGSTNLTLATGGDQIIAYQGTTSNPQALTGIQFAQGSWDSDANNDTNSDIPYDDANTQDLVNGTNANLVDKDNGSYDMVTTSGTKSVLGSAINTVANWDKDDNPNNVTTHSEGDNFSLPPNIASNWSLTPPNGAKRNSTLSTLVFDFGQNISAGTSTFAGDIQIWNDAHSAMLGSFDIGDTEVTIAGTSITVDVSGLTFVTGTSYEVDLAERIITENTDGNANKAVVGDTYWKFTIDDDPPTIQTTSLDIDNAYIDVTFDEGVYNTSGASGALEGSDFAINFLTNGSTTLTNVTISSAKQNDDPTEVGASALVGGETSIRLFLTLTGSPDGQETIEPKPVASSIFDEAGNAALNTTTAGPVFVNDKLPPFFVDSNLADDISYVDLTFDEGVYNTNGGSGALQVSDFNLDFQQNTGNITSITVSSVKQADNTDEGLASALTGGETVIRMFLNNSGETPTGAETIEITPASNSSIYDVEGNASTTAETTGLIIVEDKAPPTIVSATLDANNTYLEVTFSEGVYTNFTGTGTATGGLAPGDFLLNFAPNSGNVTGVTIASVTQNDGVTPTAGGETVVRLFLNITGGSPAGLPKGLESIEVQPLNATSIFDLPENAMLATETTGIFLLNDQFPPSVTAVSVIPTVVDSDAGGTVTFTIDFDEPMAGGSTPTLNFPITPAEDPSATLPTINGASTWNTTTQYLLVYDVVDVNEAINNIDIRITGATDAIGNVQNQFDEADKFNVDMDNPVVTQINPSLSIISENDLIFQLEIVFDHAMVSDGTFDPDITFPTGGEDPVNTLGASITSDSWTDAFTYVAEYTLTDADETILNIDVNVANARELATQNVVVASTTNDVFSIDNQNPTAAITFDDPDLFLSPGQIVRITAVFNEAMADAPIVQSVLTGVNTNPGSNMTKVSATEYYYDHTVTTPLPSDGTVNVTLTTGTDVNGNLIVSSPTSGGVFNVDASDPSSNPADYTLSPLHDTHNIPLNQIFTITLNEIVVGSGSADIFLKKFDGTTIGTFNSTDVFGVNTVTEDNTGTIDPASVTLSEPILQATEYHVIINPGAVIDRAGNPFNGFTDDTFWFVTTFGAPSVGVPAAPGCIGGDVIIPGKFFTGVTEVRFGGPTGDIVTSFTVDNDDQITATVPTQALTGTIYMEKQNGISNPGGTPANSGDVSSESVATYTIGPRAAVLTQFDGSSIDNICDDGSSAVTTTSIKIDVDGGVGPYNLIVTDGDTDYAINAYTSGSIIVIPITSVSDLVVEPASNPFTIVSIEDANGCFVVGSTNGSGGAVQGHPVDGDFPDELSGSYVITVWERSVVDPGSDQEVCVAVDSQIQLAGAITGSVTTGTWTTNGSGTFVDTGTGSSNLLNAVYDIELADITLGQLDFTLTSTTPGAPNPCAVVQDVVTVVFTATKTANAGPDLDICVSDPSVQLNGAVGGGSTTGTWIVVPDGIIDGSFDNPNILNPTYTMSPEEQTAGSVTLRLTTTDGTCGPDASDEMILSIGPNPTISKNVGPESVCVNTTFVTYSVNGPSTNTYDWILPANATLVSGNTTKSIIVDWGNTDGLSPITVEEQGEGTGCFSNIVTFNVMVNPLPTPGFVEPLARSFSTTAPNVNLIGGFENPGFTFDPADPLTYTIDDGVFSGNGVIFNTNDPNPANHRWEFDPDVAGVTTAGNEHDITFTYTDANGCLNTQTEQFTVFDASASVVIVGTGDAVVLADEYCEDNGQLHVKVADTFTPATGYVFESFSGPGITDNGDGTAFYDPQVAANQTGGGVKLIQYTQQNTNFPFDIIPFGSQVTTVNLVPQLAPDPIALFHCNNDPPISLTRDAGINPLNTFSFSIIGGDPNGLIDNPSTGVFNFNPGNEVFTPDDFTGHTYAIEYIYTDGTITACDDKVQFNVTIYQRPPQPVSPDVSACIGQPLPSLTLVDPVLGANIRWYDNAALTGDPFIGTIFNPTITQDVTFFYVTQEINGCTSVSEEVKVERFPLPVVDMSGFDSPAEYCVDASSFPLTITPVSDGVFGGDIDGVVDNGDGTFSFDPLLAAGGNIGILDPLDLTLTYSFTIAATGCTDQVIQDITINPINFVNILNLQDNQEFCVDDVDYTLTPNISTGSEGTGTFSGNGIVSGNVFRPSAAGAGTHPITYFFTNNNGCVDFQTLNVIVNPLPLPSFTDGTKCASLDVQFTSTTPGNIVQWNWEFNDDNATGSTNTSDIENPTHAFSLAGTYNVQLTVIDDKGCQASVTNVVTVGENPSPSFDFEALAEQKNSWFLNTTPALVNSTLTKETWTIEEWDGTDLDVIVVDPALIGTQQDYVFMGPGRKKVTLEVETDKGCVASITKELFIVPFIQVAASTNYSENFDNSDGGWVSWGFDTPNNEWSFGTATGLFEDASMGNTWYTQPDNDEDDISFVYSPCFDITALTRPVVTLNTFTDTKNGAIIQYSTDGRFGEWKTLGSKESGISWYNTEIEQQLQSIPGNPVGYGWKTENSGWNESRHSLGSITQGRDNLVFRIVFKGIQGDPATQGFAFDNFRIDDRDRIVLVEHFENTSTTDISNLGAINDFGKDDNGNLNISELVKIQYRTGFGGSDNLYDENRADVNARALFYDVTTANRAMIDGDNSQTGKFQSWGQNMFGTKSLISPDIEFENIDISQRPSGQVDIQVALKAKVDVNGRFLTQVVIVEDQVGSDNYEYVMRKMLPDAGGTISNGLAKDEQLTLPAVTWDNPFAEDFNNLYVIVFSQMVNVDNAGVKKVMQATIEPLVIDGDKVITGISTEISRDLLLYPNPASETLNVVFTTFEEKTVRVFDQFGKMVHDKDLDQGVRIYHIETAKFSSGVYFIQIESSRNELIREKFILSH